MLAVLGLLVVLSAAALAVDLSMLMAARTQLGIAADAAALAGVKELPFGSRDRARTRAVEYAALNQVLGTPVTLEVGQGGGGDVELGFYDFDHRSFQPEDLMPNAVRVTARRTGERAVPTFFAAVFGQRHVDVSSQAVAVGYPRTGVLVFDRSASMGDPPPAIGPARTAAANFLRSLASSTLGERMGVVAYASLVDVLSPIRGLHDPGQPAGIVAMTQGIQAASHGTEGGTNTGEAIERAVEMFAAVPGQGRNGGQRMIVLLSDGLANRGRHGEDCNRDGTQTVPGNACWRYAVEAAAEAHVQGIVVHTISLGEEPNQVQQMREIAEAGGHGQALVAPTPEQLDEMFDTLARSAQVALVN